MSPQELADAIRALGVEMDGAALPALSDYLENLVRWNRVMNLVGVSTWQRAVRTLVVDSFHLAAFLSRADVVPEAQPRCWDLGSGAGLPGIPLRMLWQQGEYTLVESREKRALFMRTALARHPLRGTKVFHGRAEAFMAEASPADLVVSRAFMPWRDLLAFVAPHLAPKARVVLLLNEALELPDGGDWREVARMPYPVEKGERLFMALTRA